MRSSVDQAHKSRPFRTVRAQDAAPKSRSIKQIEDYDRHRDQAPQPRLRSKAEVDNFRRGGKPAVVRIALPGNRRTGVRNAAKTAIQKRSFLEGERMVGQRGFEPPTPCPPDTCANQAALLPVPSLSGVAAGREGFSRFDPAGQVLISPLPRETSFSTRLIQQALAFQQLEQGRLQAPNVLAR